MLKEDFERKSKNNPLNLFSQCNYCDNPQPRYKLHPSHSAAFPNYTYLPYEQCLPGCVANQRTRNITTYLQSESSYFVEVTNDISCAAFDPSPANNVSKPANVKGIFLYQMNKFSSKPLDDYFDYCTVSVNNFCIITSAVLQAHSKPQLYPFSVLGLRREVVSIYNNNFTTPESRIPYFIEVHRCVWAADLICGTGYYPMPSRKTEIEIVVPDLTNNYRGGPEVFYKNVVYNHTSCKCGKPQLDKKITLQESEGKILETRMAGCYLVSNMCTKAPFPLIARINSQVRCGYFRPITMLKSLF